MPAALGALVLLWTRRWFTGNVLFVNMNIPDDPCCLWEAKRQKQRKSRFVMVFHNSDSEVPHEIDGQFQYGTFTMFPQTVWHTEGFLR